MIDLEDSLTLNENFDVYPAAIALAEFLSNATKLKGITIKGKKVNDHLKITGLGKDEESIIITNSYTSLRVEKQRRSC